MLLASAVIIIIIIVCFCFAFDFAFSFYRRPVVLLLIFKVSKRDNLGIKIVIFYVPKPQSRIMTLQINYDHQSGLGLA